MTNLFDFAIEDELTKEEKELLNFINEYAEYKPNKWIAPTIIQLTLHQYFKPTSDNEHNDLGRLRLRTVVNSLRGKGRLIVSSRYGYKKANEEETRRYIENYMNSALRKLKTAWAMKDALSKDGQMQLTNYGIEKVEAFIKEMK